MTNAQVFGREWLQSSFVTPVPTPAYYPSDAPLVCVQFNADWLPLVVGCLTQLTQPAAWQGDEGSQDASVQCANDLIAIFGEAYGGADCPMIRLTDGCELQESSDGGATWTTIDGWDANAAGCFVGPPGVPGSVGPIGPSSPGTPPLQSGQTTPDLACSVAGYLAQTVIRQTLQFLISGIGESQAVADILTAILTTFIGGPGLAVLATTAVNGIYQAITGGTLSEYEDAEGDDTLWADVTCAIYEATASVGYVNDDNFAAVLTNIAAISYAHPDVITAIVAYLTQGGAIYLETVQIPGALAVADCSGCGTWCWEFDFITSDGGASSYDPGITTWVPGTGWVGSYDAVPNFTECGIVLPFAANFVEEADVTFVALVAVGSSGAPSGNGGTIYWELGGTLVSSSDTGGGGSPTPVVQGLTIEASIDEVITVLRIPGNVTPPVIQSVILRGAGSNPFGTNNC